MNTETQPSNTTQNTSDHTEGEQSNIANGQLTGDLQDEICFYRVCVQLHPQPDTHRAYLLLKLAWASRNLPDHKHIEKLAEAKRWGEEAAFLLANKRSPHSRFNRANAQLLLGRIIADYPVEANPDKWRQALRHYMAALRFYTEIEHFQDWAGIQSSMGHAYYHLKSGRRTANLRKAIVCTENALKFYTRSYKPLTWACLTTRLGVLLYDIPAHDHVANLYRSLGCFQDSLSVYTKADHPETWAVMQIRLGCTYEALFRQDAADTLQLALTFYKRALRFYKKSGDLDQWAKTQQYLGMALQLSEEATGAKQALAKALRGFQDTGNSEGVQQVENALCEMADA